MNELFTLLKDKGVIFEQNNGPVKLKLPKSLDQQTKQLLMANKEPFKAYIETLFSRVNHQEKIQVRTVNGPVMASFAQQRLWFIDRLQNGSPEYHMPMAYRVTGELDLDLLERVFQTIVSRHEVLRTVYIESAELASAGEVEQHIMAEQDTLFKVSRHDLSHLADEVREQQAESVVASQIESPFNLAKDLMLRVDYIKLAQAQGILLFNMHHIASDGWSMAVLSKEFFNLYHAYAAGQDNPLEPLAIQYADYAHWQRENLVGETLDSQLDYWSKQLDEAPPVHGLAIKSRPDIPLHQGGEVTGQLSGQAASALISLAKQFDLTPFMLLHSALSLVLARHSNTDDIVIGTVMANRQQLALEPLIGFFVNTLVLRTDTRHDTIGDYFAHIKQVHQDAQAHQDVPFEQLVERLKVARNTAYTPLFQIMLTNDSDYGLDSGDDAQAQLPGVTLSAMETEHIEAKFDLNIDFNISEQGLGLNWTYDLALFEHSAIASLNDHLCRLLLALSNVANVDQNISQVNIRSLPMLADEQTHHLVNELNQTEQNYPKDQSIHQLFEHQASQNPDKVALVFEDQSLSYQQLNQKANQLAHYLLANHAIKPDTLVGICAQRSLNMVIGILAILKTGGAYLPLEPNYPAERLHFMLQDAAVDVVLTQSSLTAVLDDFAGAKVLLDNIADDGHDWGDYPVTNIPFSSPVHSVNDMAYVIYTSGSTGQPKGVMTPHLAVVRLVIGSDFMVLNQDTVMLHSANIAFDAATLELWGPLLNGGRCVLYAEPIIIPEKIDHLIEQQQITSLWLTAGLFSQWTLTLTSSINQLNSLKQVLAGGDVLEVDGVDRFQQALPQVQLINGYGPTENTTFSCCYPIPNNFNKPSVPIGHRLSADQVFILSANQQLVPKGTVGELYVGGDGLARGYLNQPALTAERFIDNPFYTHSKAAAVQRLYKTGDLVRYSADNILEFIGRADNQVKIRGFRIELDEIATRINQLDAVQSAVVLIKTYAQNKQIIAYVQLSQDARNAPEQDIEGLKTLVADSMPEYMIPSAFVIMESWPLTANGKIDRHQLPSADDQLTSGQYVAPENDVEQSLTEIWSELLGLDAAKISVTANFFELGGHSLLVNKLMIHINNQFEVELKLMELFKSSVLKEQAELISNLIVILENEKLANDSSSETQVW